MTRSPPLLPEQSVPAHVAVIMDGNGRWAQNRGQPRPLGHRAGVRAARRVVRAAGRSGVQILTVFAFSQENWRRPAAEVELLMQLFISTLTREIGKLHKNGVRLRFIGDHSDFPQRLRDKMDEAVRHTQGNDGLQLVVAVGYGGQQDIVRAAVRCHEQGIALTEQSLEAALDTHGLPCPDLLIRTGGERRISNFLLWQLAYTELYFCDTLWPDFGDAEFTQALSWYSTRQRRFGRVPESA